MKRRTIDKSVHGLCWTLAWLAQGILLSGCATILRGTHQTVTLVTNPAGETVLFQGRTVKDGESFNVDKHVEEPTVYLNDSGRPIEVQLKYDPDVLLVADGALLFVFVIPGLVALGVDFATGAWRDLHSQQLVYVPTDTDKEAVSASVD